MKEFNEISKKDFLILSEKIDDSVFKSLKLFLEQMQIIINTAKEKLDIKESEKELVLMYVGTFLCNIAGNIQTNDSKLTILKDIHTVAKFILKQNT